MGGAVTSFPVAPENSHFASCPAGAPLLTVSVWAASRGGIVVGTAWLRGGDRGRSHADDCHGISGNGRHGGVARRIANGEAGAGGGIKGEWCVAIVFRSDGSERDRLRGLADGERLAGIGSSIVVITAACRLSCGGSDAYEGHGILRNCRDGGIARHIANGQAGAGSGIKGEWCVVLGFRSDRSEGDRLRGLADRERLAGIGGSIVVGTACLRGGDRG